ncbi:hypothetical protein XELAEV_18006072mg [Xenopus laevis]|uniref:Uncharacterized protein n=1 Tax=Xenopus laevis TaxID=8355 RepID=A0A974DYH7_XENLA|nr:hypothetical protein XELAEV_18006072mg [Xenopus laevis]
MLQPSPTSILVSQQFPSHTAAFPHLRSLLPAVPFTYSSLPPPPLLSPSVFSSACCSLPPPPFLSPSSFLHIQQPSTTSVPIS